MLIYEEVGVQSESPTEVEQPMQENTGNDDASTVGSEKPRTFTQEEVNELIRNRLERDRGSLFNRYGAKDRDELDNMMGKVQSYDIMKERYGLIKDENKSLKEELSFLNNGINPKKRDDVRAYFKGKELDLTEDLLKQELATHPEWLKVVESVGTPKTTIETFGTAPQTIDYKETEEEKQKRIFGI